MAVLNAANRQQAYVDFIDSMKLSGESLAVIKSDLKAAIDATDDWVDSNAVSFNNSLPAAAKANLTVKQKARLLVYVIKKRFEVS
jgi:uncharacterized protein YaiE (UPF0345 family)